MVFDGQDEARVHARAQARGGRITGNQQPADLLGLLRRWWEVGHQQGVMHRGGWLFPGQHAGKPISTRHYGLLAASARKDAEPRGPPPCSCGGRTRLVDVLARKTAAREAWTRRWQPRGRHVRPNTLGARIRAPAALRHHQVAAPPPQPISRVGADPRRYPPAATSPQASRLRTSLEQAGTRSGHLARRCRGGLPTQFLQLRKTEMP